MNALDDEDRNKIVRLNVGGHLFTTYKATLCKSPYFQALCSGKFNDKLADDGSYFIDRNGEHFRYLLDFLRCGFVEIPSARASTLQHEAHYFQIRLDLSSIIEIAQRPRLVLHGGGSCSSQVIINGDLFNKEMAKRMQISCWPITNVVDQLVNQRNYKVVASSSTQNDRGAKWHFYYLEPCVPTMFMAGDCDGNAQANDKR